MSLHRSIKRESEHMSSTLADPPSDDAARQAEDHATFDRKRPRPDDDSSASDGPDPVRPRPLSWHPSAPVEPSTQLRSIGVESILNPPSKTAVVAAENGRDGLASPLPTVSSSHARLPSSPSVHLPSPSLHPAKRLSSSPAMRSHQTIAPASPSARFVAATGGYPQKLGVSQSPLAHASRLASYSTAPGSPLTIDPVSGQPIPTSTHQAAAPISTHSTPTFHSRRTSANPTPAPSSQETSPTTPISAYSKLGRSSPTVSAAPLAQHTPAFLTASPYLKSEPATRLPSVMAGPRHTGEETTAMGGPPENLPYPGMIPCILDLKSGSSSQAEKRRANSDASRRFRIRKRNELQLEQKIAEQQDEIRKHTEAMQRQAQEIRSLIQERDFYRSERDFFREHVTRLVPAGQLPTRPASPRALRPSFEPTASEREREAWLTSDGSRKVVETTSGPGGKLAPAPSNLMARSSTRPPVTWSTTPTSYPATHIERSILPDEQQARSLPQFPGQWARSS